MNFDLEDSLSKITKHPIFIKQKEIIEKNSYHDNQSVYDHALQTADIAKREISGNFILNPEAKNQFNNFLESNLLGIKKKDSLVIAALIHDIGKVYSFKENGKVYPLLSTLNGATNIPGHEYLGSKLTPQLLSLLDLPREVVEEISNIVRLHDTFNAQYFANKADWNLDEIVNDVKAKAEGFYLEVLFIRYCDCYEAKPFQDAKKAIEKIFNNPLLYTKREYLVL